MKPDMYMDVMMQKLEAMNELLNMTHDEAMSVTRKKKKKGEGEKRGGTGSGGGFFGAAGKEMFFRRNGEKRPGILGISHPSDGHPQEELTPDFNWFRPLSWNNPTWTLYWPELIV